MTTVIYRFALTNHTLEFHPLATPWPLLEGDEFAALVADIKKNGQRVPIVLYEDKILDGRNRYLACRDAGLDRIIAEPYHGGDPLGLMISLNQHRRHLTTTQRAAIASELATLRHGGDRRSAEFKGSNDPLVESEAPTDDASVDKAKADDPAPVSIEESAKALKVSPASVKRAKKRMKDDPTAHELAKQGKLPRKEPVQPTQDDAVKRVSSAGYNLPSGSIKEMSNIERVVHTIVGLNVLLEPKLVESMASELREDTFSEALRDRLLKGQHLREATYKLHALGLAAGVLESKFMNAGNTDADRKIA